MSCTNGYWGIVNADLVVDCNGTGTAIIRVVDVTYRQLFFWCRHRAENLVLDPDPIDVMSPSLTPDRSESLA